MKNRMRFIRFLSGKTLDEIAKKTGIDVPKLSRSERDLAELSLGEKERVAKELDAAVEAVFPKED